MSFLALIITLIATLFLFFSCLAFLKAKDVFVMNHIVMAINLYILPLLLVGLGMERFSWASCLKILFLVLLNLIVVHLLVHAILRRCVINKVLPKDSGADS